MKTKFTLSVLSLLFSLLVIGQNADLADSVRGGGGGFDIGYGIMDVSDLEAFLPQGSESLRNEHLLLGGGGRGFIGRFVIGGSGYGMLGDNFSNDSLKVSLGGGLGTFDFGYLVLNLEQVKIYPLMGIGGGGYGIQISENENVSQEEVQEDPGREINLSTGGFVADFSINMNLLPIIEYDDEENAYGGPMVGLSLGYTYGWPSSDWSFSGGEVQNGPDFNIQMLYVKLTIGGMGFERVE